MGRRNRRPQRLQAGQAHTYRLTHKGNTNRRHYVPMSLQIALDQRCGRIEGVFCYSHYLVSLAGCPDGLRELHVGPAPELSDFSPLTSCSMMKSLVIEDSSIADISAVASMPLLEVFECSKENDTRDYYISDLSPLASCPRLKKINLWHNVDLMDLSPLSSCTDLEDVLIGECPLISDLTPLSVLKSFRNLECPGIDPHASLLPLLSCTALRYLRYDEDAIYLDELIRRRPDFYVWSG